MNKLVIYIHGKGGNAAEAEHYRALFPDSTVVGFDYYAETPWEAEEEFSRYFDTVSTGYDTVSVIANSIGAYFVMNAWSDRRIAAAYFISPVVDMEKLIADRLAEAGVSEQTLRERREIPTAFGDPLSWDYLCYVREHPLRWRVPTRILCGERDALTSLETMSAFAARIGATLTVMEEGEHWFHTEEQLRFLDEWLRRAAR